MKIKYGGGWALIINAEEELGRNISSKLALEGFNIIALIKNG